MTLEEWREERKREEEETFGEALLNVVSTLIVAVVAFWLIMMGRP